MALISQRDIGQIGRLKQAARRGATTTSDQRRGDRWRGQPPAQPGAGLTACRRPSTIEK